MATQIFKTYKDFLMRDDETVNGVSPDFAREHPNWDADNSTNIGCWNCINCHNCNGCDDCNGCNYCYRCNNCNGCNYCNYCDDCNDCNDCNDCDNSVVTVWIAKT
jgi:hypothetical protein